MRRFAVAAALLALSLPLFATEPNPSKRQRELVGKLLVISGENKSSKAMMDEMFAQMQKAFLSDAEAKGNRPQDITEANEMFDAFRRKVATIDIAGTMEESYVRIYAKYFTESDLEALIAFYETPIGRKAVEVLPHLVRESVEAGARELSPKIEQAVNAVVAEQEKKRPWRRTMSDMRSLAAAIEAYASDNDELYPAGDYDTLKTVLVPDYMTTFPDKDIWGHSYAYVVSPDRTRYRLVSAGADSIFDWDSRRITKAAPDAPEPATRYSERLEDDFIFADYEFLQLPVQAKAEQED